MQCYLSARNFLIMQKSFPQMHFNLLIKLQQSEKLHHRILQSQLKVKLKIMDLIERYLKEDIHLQKKDSNLLMI